MSSNHKSPGISNALQYSLLFVSGVILTVILLILEFPSGLVIVIIMGLSVSIFTIRPMYLIYKSKSLPAINRYVIKNQKKPMFGYAYALAHGDNQDIEDSLKRILKKYKQKEIQTVYGANLALHHSDADALLEFAEKMTRKDYKEYYLGAAHLLSSDEVLANKFVAKLSTPWMIHSSNASIALRNKDGETFRLEANRSVESAAGLQRYILYHMFERMEEEKFS
ncbi:hypothetical protein JSQ81_10345 [Sporosarcina sp. Marseille-Q4063]|uniref:hypothetical protein n=1 Tax=Sporosarcina sp. Marseille-Q4063 TaxID=2810514 RepID=UPI001BAF9550|nr:hypothetical protein [Sporosarcina sp. Marseille-Q4063]QUW20279.1 hypothetical protein JSQ81_10345 [Sporosarcina sp. Marseille-Q4063]